MGRLCLSIRTIHKLSKGDFFMLIELVKKHVFKDLMSTSPFFFDQSFSEFIFVVTKVKQNKETIILNSLEPIVSWNIKKIGAKEVILVDYEEIQPLTDGQRIMVWCAFKKLLSDTYHVLLLSNEHENKFHFIYAIEREREQVCINHQLYLSIPI